MQRITPRNNTRHSSRREAYSRRKRRKTVFFIAILVFIFILVIGTVFLYSQSGGKQDIIQFQGVWVYDEYTQYEFDGKGGGCMCLEDLHYEYSYKAENNKLYIDFDDESVHDCTYDYVLNGNVLSLTGGEGTIGGTYTLNKR